MKCQHCGADNDEGFKFCGDCGTPLLNPVAPSINVSKTVERESVTYSATTGHTKLIKLNCPSCGGALELPDNLTVAHCIYCGGKILLDEDGVVQERRDLTRYIELCKVSVEAKNHKEVIEYCNRILEIDPKNIDAWIDKAVATFWLTTGAHNRYNEAMEYLTKASQLAPDDGRIDETRKTLTREQAQWYTYLGNQKWDMAQKWYQIKYDSYRRLSYVWPGHNAKVDTAEYANQALSNYMIASRYAPDDVVILQNIANVVQFYDVVKWNSEVTDKVKKLEMLRARLNAESQLLKSRAELQKVQEDLGGLRTQTGFFAGMKISNAENRILQLQNEIARLERDVNSSTPT